MIRGYHADIDFGALGRHVQALTAVTIRPPTRQNIEAFRNWVNELPELVGVFVVAGRGDFLLHVAVPDTDALYAFVIDRLTERPEVADVNTSVVYEHIRRTVLEPLSTDRRLRPPAFDHPGRFFRGNLHGHSDRSDGMAAPERGIARLPRRGRG